MCFATCGHLELHVSDASAKLQHVCAIMTQSPLIQLKNTFATQATSPKSTREPHAISAVRSVGNHGTCYHIAAEPGQLYVGMSPEFPYWAQYASAVSTGIFGELIGVNMATKNCIDSDDSAASIDRQ